MLCKWPASCSPSWRTWWTPNQYPQALVEAICYSLGRKGRIGQERRDRSHQSLLERQSPRYARWGEQGGANGTRQGRGQRKYDSKRVRCRYLRFNMFSTCLDEAYWSRFRRVCLRLHRIQLCNVICYIRVETHWLRLHRILIWNVTLYMCWSSLFQASPR